VDSFEECLSAICKNLPEKESPLILFCLRKVFDKIKKFVERGNPQLQLTVVLFHMIPSVPLQLLELLLNMIAEVLRSVPPSASKVLFKFLYDVIANNFDYSRKNKCLKWYLALLSELKPELEGSKGEAAQTLAMPTRM
jgi:hypothetical protein